MSVEAKRQIAFAVPAFSRTQTAEPYLPFRSAIVGIEKTARQSETLDIDAMGQMWKWATCPSFRTSITLNGPDTLEELMATALELEMSAFLNRYNETFATYDGEKIAEFYCVPTITMRGDGSIHCFQSREEIVRFFQAVADTYKGEGATGAAATDVVAVPLGERSALATVTWANLRADGSVARKWRQSYNVVRFAEGWRILAATFHLNATPGH